ncbi:MAG: hypothetical protein HC842_07425, partial [Cytophagales bacterium]|nr:hypothetical protein [Cytophagales bacterium]
LGQLRIQEVSAPDLSTQFKPSQDDVPSFEHGKSWYWMRFNLLRGHEDGRRWLLQVENHLVDSIDVYFIAPDGWCSIGKPAT